MGTDLGSFGKLGAWLLVTSNALMIGIIVLVATVAPRPGLSIPTLIAANSAHFAHDVCHIRYCDPIEAGRAEIAGTYISTTPIRVAEISNGH